MQKKLTALVAFLITALVLVGCSVGPGPGSGGGPTDPIYPTIDDDPNALYGNFQLGPEEKRWVSVDVPTPSTAHPAVVVELLTDAPFDRRHLTLFVSPQKDVTKSIAQSDDPDYFAPYGAFGASSADLFALTPQSINMDVGCFGPCVIVRAEAGPLHVLVENKSLDQSYSVKVHVYRDDFGDQSEAQNNSGAGYHFGNDTETVRAALETVNDRDLFCHTGALGAMWHPVVVDQLGIAFNNDIPADTEAPGKVLELRYSTYLSPSSSSPEDTGLVFSGDPIQIPQGGCIEFYDAQGWAGPYFTSKYAVTFN